MKLTGGMKSISEEWLGNLVNLTEFGKVIPTVPYNWENGFSFGVGEARRLLDQVETTEEWKTEIMAAISFHKNILMEEVVDDQKVVGKARIMGLNTVLAYVESIELSGGMDC